MTDQETAETASSQSNEPLEPKAQPKIEHSLHDELEAFSERFPLLGNMLKEHAEKFAK